MTPWHYPYSDSNPEGHHCRSNGLRGLSAVTAMSNSLESGPNVEGDPAPGSASTDAVPDETRRSAESENGSVTSVDSTAGIVGDITLVHPDLLLTGAIQETPDVRVEPNYRTADGESTLLVFRVDCDALDTFESALACDHTVTDVLAVERETDFRVYRARLTDAVVPVTPTLGRLGVQIREVVGTGQGWTLRAQFPSRDVFSKFRSFCADNGVTFQVNRLSWADDEAESQAKLTPCQHETLYTAYESGYFDVPRRISQKELAERIGVSSSAISQRLRRATSALLEDSQRDAAE